MKKLATVALAATLLFGSFNVIADASTADLRDKLVSLGFPSDSANQLVTYLQLIDLTDAQKAELEGLVKQAASKVGLVLTYDTVNGVYTITLVSVNGQQILTLSAPDIAGVLQNFDGDMIKVVETIIETTVETVLGTNTPGFRTKSVFQKDK